VLEDSTFGRCLQLARSWKYLVLSSAFNTTGEPRFPECRSLPRVPKIGHLGKLIFLECCTRGRKALGKERLSRVPRNPWHSGKGDTRGKPSSPSATLGEEWHSQKKIRIWRCLWTESFAEKMKNAFPECHALELREGGIFPECHAPALGEGASSPSAFSWHSGVSSPSVTRKHSGKYFYFFSFFAPFFFVIPCHII
jgi:hypothetical protein